MTSNLRAISSAVLLLVLSGCAATAPHPRAKAIDSQQPRSAEAIIADIEAVVFPTFDAERRNDEEWAKQFSALQEEANAQHGALVLELYRADSGHERLPQLLRNRWISMMWGRELWGHEPRTDELRRELDEVIAERGHDEIGVLARYTKTQLVMHEALFRSEPDVAAAFAAVERFASEVPSDARAAGLLLQLAGALNAGSNEQVELYNRIAADYPESLAATTAVGKLRQVQSIGQPFELAFTCAVSGSEIDIAALRGKVVVIDFWATWCGPCVAKMPQFKEFYAKYKEKGLEIIGVSLDQPLEQGGLDRVRTFVDENDIPWPQYYQGNGWDSEFSMGWGINSIPAIFVVDKHGNLRSTSARSNPEEVVSELLQEAYPEARHGG